MTQPMRAFILHVVGMTVRVNYHQVYVGVLAVVAAGAGAE